MKPTIVTKSVVLAVTLVVVTAGAVGFLVFKGGNEVLVSHELESLGEELDLQGFRLVSGIEALRQDTLFLSETPPIQGLIRAQGAGGVDPQDNSTTQEWSSRLAVIFTQFLVAKPTYFSARYIGVADQGRELVRVDRMNDSLMTVAEADLQTKADSPYFQEAIRLGQGEIYLSEISLNREYGQVVEPHRPVLRAAVPVYTTAEEVFGIVVLNMDFTLALERANIGRHTHFITNDAGDFLVHPNPNMTFGFDLGARFRLQDLYPQLAKMFEPGNNDTEISLTPSSKADGDAVHFLKVPFDPQRPERFFGIAQAVPYQEVVAESAAVRNQSLVLTLLLVGGGVVVATIFSRVITRPLKQITQAAEEFAAGQYEAPLPTNPSDEIGALARSMATMAHQVNEREAALKESNALLEGFFNYAPNAIIVVSQEGRFQRVNTQTERMFGYRREELVGQPVEMLLPEALRQTHEKHRQNYMQEPHNRPMGSGLELHGRRKDGSLFPVDITLGPLTTKEGRVVLAIIRDITERKQAEENLRESEERFASVLHSLDDVVWAAEPDGSTLNYINEAVEQIYGRAPIDFYKNPNLWLEAAHPEDRSRVEASHQELLEKGHAELEYRIVRPDGQVRWLHDRKYYILNDGGQPVRMVGLASDITARKQMEAALTEERVSLAQRVEERTAELSRVNAELGRASRMKDEFLAAMSHELRTPLNAVLGLSEALQEQVYGPLNEKQLKSLKNIEESGRHLLSLINDILDVSKIEAGMMELEIAAFPVRRVCEASLRLVKQMAHKKQIKVTAEYDAKLETITADEVRLKQILANLLSNAVKFTPEGGRVGLKVVPNAKDECVQFTVHDTGEGIPPEHMEELFQPFVQLDSSLSRQHAGTGLGLALVYRLVDMHGGSIKVESKVGEGSRFTVCLPWQGPAPQEREGAAQGAEPETLALKAGPAPQDQPLVLLAEDNEVNITTLKDYLVARGYRVKVARNGREALERARETRPEVVLMDIQMPEMDGLEAIRRLRADPELVSLPVIALTALAMRGDRERCLEAGADDYMSKPVRLKELVKMIENQRHKRRKAR